MRISRGQSSIPHAPQNCIASNLSTKTTRSASKIKENLCTLLLLTAQAKIWPKNISRYHISDIFLSSQDALVSARCIIRRGALMNGLKVQSKNSWRSSDAPVTLQMEMNIVIDEKQNQSWKMTDWSSSLKMYRDLFTRPWKECSMFWESRISIPNPSVPSLHPK